MRTRFIDENQYGIYCSKNHRYPYHVAGFIVIKNRKAYWRESGECVELNIKDMSEIVKIMKKLEKRV
jgi:hypothetical protein